VNETSGLRVQMIRLQSAANVRGCRACAGAIRKSAMVCRFAKLIDRILQIPPLDLGQVEVTPRRRIGTLWIVCAGWRLICSSANAIQLELLQNMTSHKGSTPSSG
jgi:hypothetical protein